ncbi:MAG: histidine kinase [Bacteroidetes bacterium]|nr:histidine kinase [Bacteroidota bacterium]
MRYLFLYLFIVAVSSSKGQKLPFQNYGVDKGLIQSQVLSITQDKQRHLWIGTFSGIDRFDGTTFRHYTKRDGINSAIPTALFTAADGKIWLGTFLGVSCFDGNRFVNYPADQKSENSFFQNFAQDKSGKIYVFSQADGLFMFQNNKFSRIKLPYSGATPVALSAGVAGQVLVYFKTGEVYSVENASWKLLNRINNPDANEWVVIGTEYNNIQFHVSSKGFLLKVSGGNILQRQKINAQTITSICSGKDGNIWIGTDKGVLLFDSGNLELKASYNASAGLTDNVVRTIFKDADDNIWIGSDGDGLYRYSGSLFTRFDKSTGLPGNIIMGLIKDRAGNPYLATKEGDLVKYDIKEQKIKHTGYAEVSKSGINCIEIDSASNIFIGTIDNRLLKYDGKKFSEILLDKGRSSGVNTIAAFGNKLWIATSSGCYFLENNNLGKVPGLNEMVIGLLPLNDTVILMSGIKGAYEYHLNGPLRKIKKFENTDILGFYSYRQYILIGTIDEGLLCWNRTSDKVDTCDISDGLADNMIFSIYKDPENSLWIGSGTGLQRVLYDDANGRFKVRKFTNADGYESVETSMNTITADGLGQVWIGTTKGAFRYNASTTVAATAAPYIVIQAVSSENAVEKTNLENTTPWNNLDASMVLSYQHNSITFGFKGISFKDPASVTYSYQLVGADPEFSAPVSQNSVLYKNLKPGNYTFRVKAFNGEGIPSANIAEYRFTVSTAFYQTVYFRIAAIALLILSGVLLQIFISKMKQQRFRKIELLRIKEQEIIREKTSEDFHDELGNKLTRISLLTDILQKKLELNEDGKEAIVHKIRENVTALYSGTKDIIWSLSPGSDSLKEILNRILVLGNELLNESGIEFSFSGIQDISENITLSMDYSRNLVMIYKELLNNTVKHAGAGKVSIQVSVADPGDVTIEMADNGAGFNPTEVKRGNGLNNISRRAERINATLTIQSGEGKGSLFVLKFRIPPKGVR